MYNGPFIVDSFISGKYTYSIVRISNANFCVTRQHRNMFGKKVKKFSCLYLNGTSMFTDVLANRVSIGDFDRCQYIFNALKVEYGVV